MIKFLEQNLLYNYLKQFYFRIRKCYGKNVTLQRNVELDSKVYFEGSNAIFRNTKLKGSYIGYGTYIANNSTIARAKIGRYCAIGDNVTVSLGLHPSKEFVSIHPAFFSLNKQAGFTYVNEQLFKEHIFIDDSPYCVEIGNDVWIGNNVLIFDGVKIGNGAIIGAGAVVTKDVEDYSITLGIPAKHVKYRFTKDVISRLMDIKWWDKDLDWIKKNSSSFKSVETFLLNNDL